MPISPFLHLFSDSPIHLLQEQMRCVCDAASLLIPFFKSSFEGQWEESDRLLGQMGSIGERANKKKHLLRLKCSTHIFLPISRIGILGILATQDSLIENVQQVAEQVLDRKLILPIPIQGNFMQYLKKTMESIQQASKSVRELDDLFEAGFG